jgi:hypothetical protein
MLSTFLTLALATVSVSAQRPRPATTTSGLRNSTITTSSSSSNITSTGSSGNTTMSSTSNISQACQDKLKESRPSLKICGAGFVGITTDVTNGSGLPGLPSVDALDKGLDSFCSQQCSDAIDVLVTDFNSPVCADATEKLTTSGVTGQDIPAIIKVFRDAVCLKNQNEYCASTLFSLLATNPNASTASVLKNQTVICSPCLLLEADVITKGVTTLSPKLQDTIKPQLQMVTDEQLKCPSSSAMGISVGSVAALALVLSLF